METKPWNYLIEEKLEKWWEYGVTMLPNFLLAIIVVSIFLILGRLVRKFSASFILSISKNSSLSSLLSGVIYTLIVIAGIMTALDIMELNKTVSSILAGVGIIGLALGFAFQDLTSNFISGAFIALKRPFDVGHTIETNGFTGVIEEIELRSTTLKTSGGLHVIIPNKEIFQKPIINYSLTDARRVEFEFVIPNSVDANFAERLVKEAIQPMSSKEATRSAEYYYTSIENPNMRVNVSFWTNHIEPRDFVKVKHRAILAIYNAFRDHKIYVVTIPGDTDEPQKG
jgi:small conductance mechanosensitive channel